MKDIINITMGELQIAFDNEVMKAVQKVGIDVNKDELLKALELHRNLVRCKECKHWQNNHLCKRWSIYGTIETLEDGFCYMGERRE